jgi:hypothetical protein
LHSAISIWGLEGMVQQLNSVAVVRSTAYPRPHAPCDPALIFRFCGDNREANNPLMRLAPEGVRLIDRMNWTGLGIA